MTAAEYIDRYFAETAEIVSKLDRQAIAGAIKVLDGVRAGCGRVFVLGIGGSAANASHMVNDLRKIAGIETYSPADNVAEFSAWANDAGWENSFVGWLKESRLRRGDALVILSVGGGSATTSQNLVKAMELAKEVGAAILSIVSRDGGRAAQLSDVTVLVPVVSKDRITPHAEGFQGVIGHLIVNALVACG